MSIKQILIAFVCTLFVFLFSFETSQASTRCVVWNVSDTAENTRATPNGLLINRLRNGRVVYIEKVSHDYQGRPWAYISGDYNGQWRNWGWMIMDSLRCR